MTEQLTKEPLKTTVYSPESGIRKPGKLLKEIIEGWTNSWGLGWRLFLRNFKGMYRQSLLGLAWTIIPPHINHSSMGFPQQSKNTQYRYTGCTLSCFCFNINLTLVIICTKHCFPYQQYDAGKIHDG